MAVVNEVEQHPAAAAGGARPHGDGAVERERLRMMMLIRRFEERTSQSYTQTKIGGFCHIYIGQEATAVGSIAALRPDDPIITAYRDHGHALARGMDPRHAMAEMYGRATGCASPDSAGWSRGTTRRSGNCRAGSPCACTAWGSGRATGSASWPRTAWNECCSTWRRCGSVR